MSQKIGSSLRGFAVWALEDKILESYAKPDLVFSA